MRVALGRGEEDARAGNVRCVVIQSIVLSTAPLLANLLDQNRGGTNLNHLRPYPMHNNRYTLSDLPELQGLPLHDFDPSTNFCKYCGVPLYAVVDGLVIRQCGMRADKDAENVGASHD